MPDISKLGLPERVRPEWDAEGVPLCPYSGECPSYDGKRCELLGLRPSRLCEPAVEDMARAIPGFLEGK